MGRDLELVAEDQGSGLRHDELSFVRRRPADSGVVAEAEQPARRRDCSAGTIKKRQGDALVPDSPRHDERCCDEAGYRRSRLCSWCCAPLGVVVVRLGEGFVEDELGAEPEEEAAVPSV